MHEAMREPHGMGGDDARSSGGKSPDAGPIGTPAMGEASGEAGSAVCSLHEAIKRSGNCLSIGLEPSAERLPRGAEPSIENFERYLLATIAGAPSAAAFKLNLAFFEALGPDGWSLLYRVRERIRPGAFVIADAKRGDIGSSAERYAAALFEGLRADAVTVNPLMGRDAVEPFLAHEGRLAYVLCLTSNPGADDFLLENDLFVRIARRVSEYEGPGDRGLVVGATAPASALAKLAQIPDPMPLLVPGVGAQGGEISGLRAAFGGSLPAGSLVHATRAVLPPRDSAPRDISAYADAVSEMVGSFASALANGNATSDGPPRSDVAP